MSNLGQNLLDTAARDVDHTALRTVVSHGVLPAGAALVPMHPLPESMGWR